MQTLFYDHHISHQISWDVATLQQNSVIEHKHRHLLDVARALRFQTNLSPSFYDECVFTAAYIINILPTPIL